MSATSSKAIIIITSSIICSYATTQRDYDDGHQELGCNFPNPISISIQLDAWERNDLVFVESMVNWSRHVVCASSFGMQSEHRRKVAAFAALWLTVKCLAMEKKRRRKIRANGMAATDGRAERTVFPLLIPSPKHISQLFYAIFPVSFIFIFCFCCWIIQQKYVESNQLQPYRGSEHAKLIIFDHWSMAPRSKLMRFRWSWSISNQTTTRKRTFQHPKCFSP